MRYLLDANVLLHAANEVPGYRHIVARINEEGPDAARLSAVTFYELRFKFKLDKSVGSSKRLRALSAWLGYFRVLPFTVHAARKAAAIRAQLERAGTPIGPLDVLAAGHALALGYTMVTDNVREFGRVPGLRLENWLR